MTVAVLGEALVDFIAGCDGAFRAHLGGSPYNVAIGLARQGVDVSYLSPLSDDAFGDRFLESLRRENVRTPMTRRSKLPTSLALVTLDDSGVPAYSLYREGIADKDLTFEEVVAAIPDDLQVFHTGSLAITPSQLQLIRQVLDLVHAQGVVVSLDVNVRLRGTSNPKAYIDGVRSLLEHADIVRASDEDLAALEFGSGSLQDAESAYDRMRSGILIYTEGRNGATLFSQQGTIRQDAYEVASPVDTVGAGDTFHSALLAALLRVGEEGNLLSSLSAPMLASALEFASAAAAINVSRKGCSPPSHAEVMEYLAANS